MQGMTNKNFNKFRETEFGEKIESYLRRVLCTASEDAGKNGRTSIVIFLSRKGYWLYRIFRRFGSFSDIGLENVVIISDRYIDKWKNPEWDFESNGENNYGGQTSIYIVDDTLTSGMSLFRVYEKVRKDYSNAKVTPATLFLSVEREELRSRLQEKLPDEEQEYLKEFINDLYFWQKAGASDVGYLSYTQISVFQESMLPYVIDLPVMVNADYDGTKIESEENHPYIILSRQKFEKMLRSSSDWVFEDNSYRWDDMLEVKAVEKVISDGLFVYCGNEIPVAVCDILRQAVIRCRYEHLDDLRTAVVFTPFAVVDSVCYEDVLNACLVLYEDTPFGTWLQNSVSAQTETEKQQMYVLLIRSFIYYLSFCIWKLFLVELEGVVSESCFKLDLDEMRENSKEIFLDSAAILENWSPGQLLRNLGRLKRMRGIYRPKEKILERGFISEKGLFDECLWKKAYIVVYQAIIDKKREKKSDGVVSIEALDEKLRKNLPALSSDVRNSLFVRVLLMMLNQSVISNRVWLQDGVVMRGFRYGENSDVALPFYNSYIFWGIEQFYFRCVLKSLDLSSTVEELFFDNIRSLLEGIRSMAKAAGYLNTLIDESDLVLSEEYFSDRRSDLETLVENKWFRLEREERLRCVEADIYICVKEII